MAPINIEIPKDKIAEFCRKWKIVEFALFGSVLRDDFRPDSDVDVMVSFHQDAHWTLLNMAEMIEELKDIFGREVDLITRRSIESSRNPFRRHSILSAFEVIHVA